MAGDTAAAMRNRYRRVFSGVEGRAVLRHMLKSSGVFAPTCSGEAPHQMAFDEGQRSFALRVAKTAFSEHELEEVLVDQLTEKRE